MTVQPADRATRGQVEPSSRLSHGGSAGYGCWRREPGSDAGFAPEEIRIDEPTRAARLKWVVIVDADLPPGRAINAAVCVAAAIGAAVPGLLGTELRALRDRAAAGEGALVVDMPSQAQHTRVYGEHLDTLARAGQHHMSYYAVEIVSPLNRVDKLVKKFPLA